MLQTLKVLQILQHQLKEANTSLFPGHTDTDKDISTNTHTENFQQHQEVAAFRSVWHLKMVLQTQSQKHLAKGAINM
jgi:hypothetical protein